MSRQTVGDALRDTIYAFIYGREGAGKTLLPMTLAKDKSDTGFGYISAETSGVTSLVTAGYSRKIPMWLLPPAGQEPFRSALQGLEEFRRDPKIHTIVLDGCTAISGRAMTFKDEDKDGHLEWGDWAEILAGFMAVEAKCEKISRGDPAAKIPPKSVIMTAWERQPTYTPDIYNKGNMVMTEEGRPFIHGQARTWLPGNCDVIARITSSFVKKQVKKVDKKTGRSILTTERSFKAQLQVHATEEWVAKTRWPLPDPCPADLRYILNTVKGAGE